MSGLTIQEVIEHCERTTKKIEENVSKFLGPKGMQPSVIASKPYLEHKHVAGWLKELQRYKDLEEQGRLIETKFAIGQTVYDIRYEETYEKAWHYINRSKFTHAMIRCQDRYFATKAEAEESLKRMQDNE